MLWAPELPEHSRPSARISADRPGTRSPGRSREWRAAVSDQRRCGPAGTGSPDAEERRPVRQHLPLEGRPRRTHLTAADLTRCGLSNHQETPPYMPHRPPRVLRTPTVHRAPPTGTSTASRVPSAGLVSPGHRLTRWIREQCHQSRLKRGGTIAQTWCFAVSLHPRHTFDVVKTNHQLGEMAKRQTASSKKPAPHPRSRPDRLERRTRCSASRFTALLITEPSALFGFGTSPCNPVDPSPVKGFGLGLW